VAVLKLDASRQHVRNWRPVMLVLVGNPKSRLPLVQFANWLESRTGLLFLAHIVTGDWKQLIERRTAIQRTMEDFIHEQRLSAEAKTVITDDFPQGVTTLLQVAGVGQVQPNTVLVGFSEDAVKQQVFAETVERIVELKRNLIVFAEAERPATELLPRIDVWWRAKENGSLMLTLAYLLQRNSAWRDHTIRVLRIIDDEAARDDTLAGMANMIAESRFGAKVEVIVAKGEAFPVIAQHSGQSAICFLGLSTQALAIKDDPLGYYDDLVAALKGNILITKSWQTLEM
jgi:hypothetical protein